MNVRIEPKLIAWARTRAGLSVEAVAAKVGTPKRPAPVADWEASNEPVSLSQAQVAKLATATRAPLGMLFLDAPPDEPMPIADLRSGPVRDSRPTLNLLETIYEYQMRQAWFSDYLREEGESPVSFVGSVTIHDEVATVAAGIRDTLSIGTEARRASAAQRDPALWLMGRLEACRITAARKGYAGTWTHRALDPNEFRGFALADAYAPMVFVNGKDWPASQVFTVAHECVHLWLGESALPDGQWYTLGGDPTEVFCNQVAAEILIPAAELGRRWVARHPVHENARETGRWFCVSPLATLFRASRSGLVTAAEVEAARQRLSDEFESRPATLPRAGGGDFHNNVGTFYGKRLVRELLACTLEGRTLYRDAFRMLGTAKTGVIQNMASKVLGGTG